MMATRKEHKSLMVKMMVPMKELTKELAKYCLLEFVVKKCFSVNL